MYPTRRTAVARSDGSDASAHATESKSTESADGPPKPKADPGLVVRDARSMGLAVGEGALAFGVTNRGGEAARLSAVEFDCSDPSISIVGEDRPGHGGYAVWTDARDSARVSVGPRPLPTTVEVDDSPSVEPGETATVRIYGFRHADGTPANLRDVQSTVTLVTERDGRRHETTAHLTV